MNGYMEKKQTVSVDLSLDDIYYVLAAIGRMEERRPSLEGLLFRRLVELASRFHRETETKI